MARHFQNVELQAQKVLLFPLPDDPIGLKRRETERESLAPEEIPIRYHRRGLGVANDRTGMSGANRGGVSDVVPVSVGENQKTDRLAGESFVGPLGGIKKDRAAGRFREETIGCVSPSRKTFELNRHKKVEATGRILLAQPVFKGNQL